MLRKISWLAALGALSIAAPPALAQSLGERNLGADAGQGELREAIDSRSRSVAKVKTEGVAFCAAAADAFNACEPKFFRLSDGRVLDLYASPALVEALEGGIRSLRVKVEGESATDGSPLVKRLRVDSFEVIDVLAATDGLRDFEALRNDGELDRPEIEEAH